MRHPVPGRENTLSSIDCPDIMQPGPEKKSAVPREARAGHTAWTQVITSHPRKASGRKKNKQPRT